MGVQISRGIHTQVSKKDVVRRTADVSGRSVPHAGSSEGASDRGGAFDDGSRTHADTACAKVSGFTGTRFYQGP